MKPYLASNVTGPYGEKQRQTQELPSGTVVSYGYRAKWVDPLVMELIKSEVPPLCEGGEVWLCVMALGNPDTVVVPIRKVKIFQIKSYDCPGCDIPVFVRIDMALLDKEEPYPPPEKPGPDRENYLFSY